MADNLPPAGWPYPGLRPFREDEFEIFFGREAQTNELLKRLTRQRFIAVTGPSGCGKSSLVAAGMVPALRSGLAVDAGSRWRVCQMRPGRSPMRALAEALAVPEIVGKAHLDAASADRIEAALRFGPGGLVQVLRESTALAGAAVLLVVDQFEEIFRFRERIDPDEADAFVHLLLASAGQTDLPVYVVITMRSDYLGDCTVFQHLPEAINDGQYLTPRLTRDECVQAIRGPARVFDGDVDAALVNALINDFTTDPDQLPLLQHALMRMWQRKAATSMGEPVVLARSDYIERLGDALDRHADEVFASLAPDQQRLAQVLFRRLTERAPGRRDTRAPATLGEVAAIADIKANPVEALSPVIEAFRREGCNFVAASPGPLGPGTMLDIGHESLIRQWHRLTGWVDAEAESADVFRRLSDAARRYAAGTAAKYWGPDLTGALAWWRQERPNQAWANRYRTAQERAADDTSTLPQALGFLQTSRRSWVQTRWTDRRRRRDDARRLRRRRQGNVFAAVLVPALALGALAGWQWDRARKADQRAAKEEATRVQLQRDAEMARYLTEPWSEYFADFTSVHGTPKGLGPPLTPDQRRRRAVSYEITSVGRGNHAKVVQMKALDARGQLTTRHGTTLFVLERRDLAEPRKEAQWQYIYDERGLLAFQIARDSAGRVAGSLVYAPPPTPESASTQRTRQVLGPDGFSSGKSCAAAQVIEFDARGFEWRERYVDRSGHPVATPAQDYAPVRERKHNESGFETEWVSLDTALRRINDSAGNASMVSLEHDPFGQPQRIELRGAAGELVEIGGFASLTRRYDDVGNLTEQRLFDRQGRPTVGDTGWHRSTTTYGAHGLPEAQRFWGVDGRPAVQEDYCHALLNTAYDDQGRLTDRQCIGTDGQPSPGRIGAPRWKIERDGQGNVTAWSYFGGPKLDRPQLARGGWHRLKRVYDGDGGLAREEYLDVRLQPTVVGKAVNADTPPATGAEAERRAPGIEQTDATGYAGIAYTFSDDRLTETSRTYLDTKGRPTTVDLGHAVERRRHDSNGNVQQHAYFGPSGREPARRTFGPAAIDLQSDACGRVVRRTFLDLNGQAMWTKDGTAGETWAYDALGRLTGRRFLSPTGQPTASSEGIAGWNDSVDRLGKPIERRYVDLGGQPTAQPDGEAGWRKTFDSHGRETSVEYVGSDGQRVATQGSAPGGRYARETAAYDALGNQVRQSYFDAQGRPTNIGDGYATVRRRFDAIGAVAEERYFGLRGEAVLDARGAHRVAYQNDVRGHAIGERYFGLSGQPILIAGRFHRVALEVDALGREQSRRHFDIAGRKVPGQEGWHARYSRWNVRGHQVSAHFTDAEGAPANAGADSGSAYHRWTALRDDHGRVREWRFFDRAGRPTAGPNGVPIARLDYDPLGRRNRVSFFDAEGQPTPIDKGWAARQWQFDMHGRLLLHAFFDRDGKPFSPANEWARTTWRYDARGREIEAEHFIADSRAQGGLRLYARGVEIFDDNRMTSELKFVDQHGSLTDNTRDEVVARVWRQRDAGGRILEERTFDKQDEPTGWKDRRAAVLVRQTYSPQGRLTLRSFHDAADWPVLVQIGQRRCVALRWPLGTPAVAPSDTTHDESAECLARLLGP